MAKSKLGNLRKDVLLLSILSLCSMHSEGFHLTSPFANRSVRKFSESRAQLENARSVSSKCTKLYGFFDNDEVSDADKVKACIPYMLPLLDGDSFGEYIYKRIPPLHALDEAFIAPMVSALQAFPLLSLVLFCLLSLGPRFVDGMSRTLRFNAQQAVLIDVGLILPTIVQEGLEGTEVPRPWAEIGCNFVWYVYMTAIVYSVLMNLRGRKPDGIPYVSQAAEMMTGPF